MTAPGGPLAFVDCYVHLIDPFNPSFHYPSFRPEGSHPHLGQHIERLKGRRYLVEDYLEASRHSNLVAAVHADANAMAEDPADETAWIQTQADGTGYPQAILGFADLEDPQVEDVIRRHLQHRNLRGIRHRSAGDYLSRPGFERGYSLLEKYGLTCDLGARPEAGMVKIRDLARRFPATGLTLHHCGIVLSVGGRFDGAFFDAWKRDLAIAAEADNISCVISGVPVFDHEWTVDSLRPWVLAVIECFGAKRSMFGSHWPYDTLFSPYEKLINAYAEIIGDFTIDEQTDLFSRNALELYRIRA